MSTLFSEKVRFIRLAEKISQPEFAELTGISINTIKGYESKGKEINSANLHTILNHSRFKKYTLWLMTGETAPATGQISPELESITSEYGKTGTDTD
jgi:transcriptional regulator with XRE-family HTH domain